MIRFDQMCLDPDNDPGKDGQVKTNIKKIGI